jgi:hypothetical protein
MNGKLVMALFVAIVLTSVIAVSFARIAYAHSDYEESGISRSEDHYREMLDLHKQYFNNEISFEEFNEEMNGEMTEHYEDMPCNEGSGMEGYNMMGMMR